ncbi:SDR family oxidoreductase [Granulicella cerasi]|uniref:SDR family oxidoreductase n=1 Tax=Granulicella cerasi TaxID=741063 RepID=A0ABW1ZCH7_9BACT|nr:SDR family oxidoreductase [Granulicella cerasi]
MIVVTGATGHYGRKVVEGLISRVPASNLDVSVRDPEKATGLTAKGIRVEKASFAEPATLAAAFDGAEQVLLVSANVLGDEAIRLHGSAIQAAKDAGVKRILYTSHQAASPTSKVAFARDHAATEELLKASGVDFVSLRNGFYAESSLYQLGGIQATGKLALPGDGNVSWTLRDDLAQAAVSALINTSLFQGITAPLTASRTYTFAEIAGLAAGALNREVVFELISAETYRQAALQRGFPEPMVGMLLSMFAAIHDNEFNIVTPTLERVLMRKPAEYQAVLMPYLTNGGVPQAH